MKNKLLTFAGAMALAASLGTYYAKPLLAQVRAAVEKNIDEPARVPYQAQISCSGLAQCIEPTGFPFVSLRAVPVHSRLVIEQISMLIQTNGTFSGLELGTFNTLSLESQTSPVMAPFTFLGFNSGPLGYLVNQSVKYYFEAGTSPSIELAGIVGPSSGAPFSLSMQGMATGYVVDLSQ
jgi:hypothetical protein